MISKLSMFVCVCVCVSLSLSLPVCVYNQAPIQCPYELSILLNEMQWLSNGSYDNWSREKVL
jgi:hypothetical protein